MESENVILFPSPKPPALFRELEECIKFRNKYLKASLQQPGDEPLEDDAEYTIPSVEEYYENLYHVIAINGNAPTKTLVGRRLKYLADKFDLYLLENESHELEEVKRGYRDLQNIYKVDTHVHHTACMSLHRFNAFVNEQIEKYRNGPPLEWSEEERAEVFKASQVLRNQNDTSHVSIDVMDMLAYRDSFHRFDNFNKKYQPASQKSMKSLFLKHDNKFNGRFLAELTRAVMDDLPNKFECCEWRISVGGESLEEWNVLAEWISNHRLRSPDVKWLIQVPRRQKDIKIKTKITFDMIMKNIFDPLFEVTQNPSSNEALHRFLKDVVGFDSVDDESKVEHRLGKTPPAPEEWDMEYLPPYSYWLYHMYAQIAALNLCRKKKGFNTFVLRPHSGEAGDPEHVAAAFLTSHGIAHGITLRHEPVLQYLYYLTQIGIAMSPISNNALFLEYEKNPLPDFFKVGLNVSLSTDDPLLFHFTRDPLLEEYSVATHIFKFSQASLAELARNSVVQSGFTMRFAEEFGDDWLDVDKNDINNTNVPTERLIHRRKMLDEEKEYVQAKAAPEPNET